MRKHDNTQFNIQLIPCASLLKLFSVTHLDTSLQRLLEKRLNLDHSNSPAEIYTRTNTVIFSVLWKKNTYFTTSLGNVQFRCFFPKRVSASSFPYLLNPLASLFKQTKKLRPFSIIYGCNIGVPKHLNGGHVDLPRQYVMVFSRGFCLLSFHKLCKHAHMDVSAQHNILKKHFSGVPSNVPKWENKTYKVKRSIL